MFTDMQKYSKTSPTLSSPQLLILTISTFRRHSFLSRRLFSRGLPPHEVAAEVEQHAVVRTMVECNFVPVSMSARDCISSALQ